MSILQAVQQGNEEAVSRLLDTTPALLEVQGADGWTPLTWAARHGQLGMVKLLVERGADINVPDVRELTALSWASSGGHEEIVGWLYSKGAQIERANVYGYTPLLRAAYRSHLGVVRLLLQYLRGQGLDSRTADGWTALHLAAFSGHDEIIGTLLLAGADPTISDNRGQTPRADAETTGHPGCVEVFQWWEGELKRRPLLQRARCLHDASTTHRHTPAAPVPAFLQARAAAGQALPQVGVVAGQQEEQQAGASGKRGTSSEGDSTQDGEEEVYTVFAYVVRQLNDALFTELMQGFHCKNE